MDEQKECNITGIHVHQASGTIKGVDEQYYQLMNNERLRIIEELAQQKAHERQIDYKIWKFSDLDTQIELGMLDISNLEYSLGKFNISLPNKFIPTTTSVLCLTGKDDDTQVIPDLKRCKKRLTKKGKTEIKYCEEVQKEHLFAMKQSDCRPYYGTQELSDMIESLDQRIKHGNKKRADEMKIFQVLSKLKKTKECYIATDPHWFPEQRSKRDIDRKQRMQHKIKIALDDIENLKGEQIGRKARIRRLKAELEHARKNICYLNKKLENVDSKILKKKPININMMKQ